MLVKYVDDVMSCLTNSCFINIQHCIQIRVAIWSFLKLNARNKIVWLFGHFFLKSTVLTLIVALGFTFEGMFYKIALFFPTLGAIQKIRVKIGWRERSRLLAI